MKRKNTTLEKVLVEDYVAEGKTLARVEGKVIFLENVVPGDLVDIRITKSKKDWAEGTVIKIHEFSSDRVAPFCSHFGVCGGCQWQMLPYEKQLFYKQRQVEETLKRIGKVSLPPTRPIVGAAETRYYRNKLEYTFGTKEFTKEAPTSPAPPEGGGDDKKLIPPFRGARGCFAGFHARGWFDKVVDIKTCYLQVEPTNAIRLAVKNFAINNDWTFYDIRDHNGFLRTMQIRTGSEGEVMVNIVVAEDDSRKIKLLMDHVAKEFPHLTSILYTINKKKNDSLFDLEPITWKGPGYITENLTTENGRAFHFRIGPKSFFQTNTKQAEKLYRVTNEFAELKGNETVYDLYCGTGSIGIFLSPFANRVIGVELIEAAVRDADENAKLNRIENARFFAGDVIDVCNDDFFSTHGKPDVIITDPPRAGMHEKLVRKILDMAAPVVVYVSCNPATQARDLSILSEKYIVTAIQPVDMFPHTHHIENIAQLKKRDTHS
ncbi:MAG TPA: 23S rRNA (uracil(1939)-C(5))-methyltransferase RlmD [Chitinophagaceae bacterium]|nr:23S rRNA (uracil(1939)-C(5))-methyltransferase RlmD [Chitinophagaceae bacterium]